MSGPDFLVHSTEDSVGVVVVETVKAGNDLNGLIMDKNEPITVKAIKKDHPVLKGIPAEWKTPEGELYNVLEVLPSATALATGDNGKVKTPQVCIWVNKFGKGRVFSTTLGHHNSTMSTKEYLDLLANGVRWVTQKKK